jgi:phage tail sheath protein FI
MGHGIKIAENPTRLSTPVQSDAACQVVVGRAQINLLDNPEDAVNKPILVTDFTEAVAKVGYSEDFDNYEINQSIAMTFKNFAVAPIIFINVLDPNKDSHVEKVNNVSQAITDKKIALDVKGILLKSIKLTDSAEAGATVYTVDEDYVAAFDDDGNVLITITEDGKLKDAETVKVSYTKLKPSGVTTNDIVGGYNAATGTYKGIECIEKVFPVLNKVPAILTAPGFSQEPVVMAALKAKSNGTNEVFKSINICDVPTDTCKTYDSVNAWKNANSYTDKMTYLGWPMVKFGTKKVYASAHMSALYANKIANLDSGVPCESPSNLDAGIQGCCLKDGTEVNLTIKQANVLNDCGVFTYINWQGWKSWGNNMACYPSNNDVKDHFINVRNFFNWWANSFILTYFAQIDRNMKPRNLDRIVDTENIRANGFAKNENIAAAHIEYVSDSNPITSVIGGTIKFNQYLSCFVPMQEIVNELEYDVDALQKVLFGGN